MGRKGWTVMEVPNGWYEVLRGPRPPFVRWPVAARGQHQHARGQSRPQSPKSCAPGRRLPNNDAVHRPPPVRVSPEAANEAARARVTSRSRDQCFGQRRRPCFEVVTGGLVKGPESHPSCPSWGAIGSVHSIHRACQEAPREIRFGVGEDPGRARPAGGRVGRRASSIGSIAHRSRIGGPHSTTSAHGCWGRIEEDAGCDRRHSEGTFPVEGFTSRWFAGCGGGAR